MGMVAMVQYRPLFITNMWLDQCLSWWGACRVFGCCPFVSWVLHIVRFPHATCLPLFNRHRAYIIAVAVSVMTLGGCMIVYYVSFPLFQVSTLEWHSPDLFSMFIRCWCPGSCMKLWISLTVLMYYIFELYLLIMRPRSPMVCWWIGHQSHW